MGPKGTESWLVLMHTRVEWKEKFHARLKKEIVTNRNETEAETAEWKIGKTDTPKQHSGVNDKDEAAVWTKWRGRVQRVEEVVEEEMNNPHYLLDIQTKKEQK